MPKGDGGCREVSDRLARRDRLLSFIFNSIDGFGNGRFDLVFPYSENRPTVVSQFAEVALVSLPRSRNLILPLWAELVFPKGEPPSVPKITVNEHGQLQSTKDDVWTAGQFFGVGRKVDLTSAEFGHDESFGLGVLASDP